VSVLALLLFLGCGYTLGPLVKRPQRNLAVPVFANESRERDLEIPLTRAVMRELRARGYVLRNTRPGGAVLLGRIVSVTQEVTAEDPADLQEAGAVSIAVDLELRSASGALLRKFRIQERGEFAAHRGETRRCARDHALAELALAVARRLDLTGF
jgi:hypothetical protein